MPPEGPSNLGLTAGEDDQGPIFVVLILYVSLAIPRAWNCLPVEFGEISFSRATNSVGLMTTFCSLFAASLTATSTYMNGLFFLSGLISFSSTESSKSKSASSTFCIYLIGRIFILLFSAVMVGVGWLELKVSMPIC